MDLESEREGRSSELVLRFQLAQLGSTTCGKMRKQGFRMRQEKIKMGADAVSS